ncbi:hypothetical protein HZB78_03105 [Candidatus Collierbacteria bacterium]|nr:hypothetical protein [Candidatus Collierbacteria bacterium]
MAKNRLTVDQRGRVSEKLMELGNLIFGGLILGQALSNNPFDFWMASIGGAGILMLYFIALRIMKGGEK